MKLFRRLRFFVADAVRARAFGWALLVASNSALGQSPVGSWDMVLGGQHQRGVAQVVFHADGTIDGIAVFTVNGNRLTHTNGGFSYRHIFGSAEVQGGWIHEGPNRISGYLNLIGSGEDEPVVNGFSLRGMSRPTRLSLLAHGPSGKMTFKGIPLSETNVADLSGTNYQGRAQVRGVPFPLIEIFTPAWVEPNVYAVVGDGPGYTYVGSLLISKQRFAAFYQERSAEVVGPPVAAYAGPFNAARRRGTLKGTDGDNTSIAYRFEPGAP